MSTALERRGPAELPAHIKRGDTRGTENIGKDDIKFPALKLAQATTPEAKRADAAYLEGLREGDLFNNITREIYGEDPVLLVIVNQLGHRNTQFDPNDRNVVLESDIPDNDPRCQFTEKIEDGKKVRVKPVATKFYDYLVLLVHGQYDRKTGEVLQSRDPELMTLSLKSTQLKKATKLNSVLSLAKLPAFAHLFQARPGPESRGANSWYGWTFDSVGFTSESLYLLAEESYDKFAGKTIAVDDVEPEGPAKTDEDIPF